MRRLIVFNNLTLDGVMQAPGHPDEDRRGGFEHGGWAIPYQDEVIGQVAAEGMAAGGPLLFGRWTYESMHSSWAGRTDNPFSEVLANSQKYVATRTLTEPAAWENTILLNGEAAGTVPAIKAEEGQDILTMGSGRLLDTLVRHDLVDRYMLLIHPLVLGSGATLFPEPHRMDLELVDAKPTTTGVIIATYDRADRSER